MPTSTERTQLSYWIVSFLDILGYRSVLADLDIIPGSEPEQEQRRAIVAFKRARGLRESLLGDYENFIDDMANRPIPVELTALSARYDVARFRAINVLRTYGPDHIVLACSLQNDETSPLSSVHAVVTASAVLALRQLARGAEEPNATLPLRGGIDVGFGARDGATGELYSPALTKAYELEETACYPRIMVGRTFLDYVDSCAAADPSTVEGRLARGLASLISGGLVHDGSGPVMLDFFGPLCRNGLSNEDAGDLGQAVWRYVSGARHDASGSRSRHVQEKYDWLYEYVRSRLAIWNVRT